MAENAIEVAIRESIVAAITAVADTGIVRGFGIHGPLPEDSAPYLKVGGTVNGWGVRLRSIAQMPRSSTRRRTERYTYLVFAVRQYNTTPESYDDFAGTVVNVSQALVDVASFAEGAYLGESGLVFEQVDQFIEAVDNALRYACHFAEGVMTVERSYVC